MSERTTGTDDVERNRNPDESGKWVSALLALLGLWMVAQAFLIDLVAAQFWNDVIVGLLLAAIGTYNYSRRAGEHAGNVGAAAVAVLIGLWLIAAPFLFGDQMPFTGAATDMGAWNDIIVGLAALGLGAYSAYKARDEQRTVGRAAT